MRSSQSSQDINNNHIGQIRSRVIYSDSDSDSDSASSTPTVSISDSDSDLDDQNGSDEGN